MHITQAIAKNCTIIACPNIDSNSLTHLIKYPKYKYLLLINKRTTTLIETMRVKNNIIIN